MGLNSSRESDQDSMDSMNQQDVEFSDFDVLRSIGKGSFGKVCIVKNKRKKSAIYAMKYMNKLSCWKQGMIDHVLDELVILADLEHPFIVNLWFTFQDDEDIFMVSDLMLGGDLRYHIQRNRCFNIEDVKLYFCEMASVLDYLQTKHIIHRDVKPENILLDGMGHLHLTDFNIAKTLTCDKPYASGFAGTKPYTAPEVFASALGSDVGYTYSADWWSLGVTMYEVLRHKRPFAIENTELLDSLDILKRGTISLPSDWSQPIKDIFIKFFKFDCSKRICNITALYELPLFTTFNQDAIYMKELQPNFIPSNNRLNYDPTYELEEMIVESKPLHKKKKRITKRKKDREKKLQRMLSNHSINSTTENSTEDIEEHALEYISKKFRPFNRKWAQSDANSKESEIRSTSTKKLSAENSMTGNG